MLRIEKLGSAFSLMPESPEKSVFQVHLTGAIANLNDWLDSDNLKQRKTIRRITVATYVIGVAGVLISLPFAQSSAPWVSSAIGAVVGVAIAAITFASSYFVERGARRKAELEEAKRESDAAAIRMEALRRGEAPK